MSIRVKSYLDRIEDIKRGVHEGRGLNTCQKELAIQRILNLMSNPEPRPNPIAATNNSNKKIERLFKNNE